MWSQRPSLFDGGGMGRGMYDTLLDIPVDDRDLDIFGDMGDGGISPTPVTPTTPMNPAPLPITDWRARYKTYGRRSR